jgi:hypothetical protein
MVDWVGENEVRVTFRGERRECFYTRGDIDFELFLEALDKYCGCQREKGGPKKTFFVNVYKPCHREDKMRIGFLYESYEDAKKHVGTDPLYVKTISFDLDVPNE